MWRTDIQTVTISFFRFEPVTARLWVLGQMGAARLSFSRMPEARFWKLCGSGVGEGFTPRPNTRVWAILAVWDDEETARDRVGSAPVYQRWRAHADESWTVFLTAQSSRGEWSGTAPFKSEPHADATGPLAVLTRATIKPKALPHFWGQEPPISAAIGADPNVLFKIGVGEIPLLHQVTFSIWPDKASMVAFAHKEGPHARAVREVRAGGWFKEELYARFQVTGATGAWNGVNPLAAFERSAA